MEAAIENYGYVDELFRKLDSGDEIRTIRVYNEEIPLNSKTWSEIFGGEGSNFCKPKKIHTYNVVVDFFNKIKYMAGTYSMGTYKVRAMAVYLLYDIGFGANQIIQALVCSQTQIMCYLDSHQKFIKEDFKYRTACISIKKIIKNNL